jgi:hypothetical protein
MQTSYGATDTKDPHGTDCSGKAEHMEQKSATARKKRILKL